MSKECEKCFSSANVTMVNKAKIEKYGTLYEQHLEKSNKPRMIFTTVRTCANCFCKYILGIGLTREQENFLKGYGDKENE